MTGSIITSNKWLWFTNHLRKMIYCIDLLLMNQYMAIFICDFYNQSESAFSGTGLKKEWTVMEVKILE